MRRFPAFLLLGAAIWLQAASTARAGSYDLTSSYPMGSVGDTRGWLIEWIVPEVTNQQDAQAVVGQWYYNLESGFYGGSGGFAVYYFGDDSGLDGNNPSCDATWGVGGFCRGGGFDGLGAGHRITFKYEWCNADHSENVNGGFLCVWVDSGGESFQFLAADTRAKSATVEMYAHDVENFRDMGATLPRVSCGAPTRMVRQQLKNAAGQWIDLTGDAWDFHADGRYIFLDRSDSSWSSCLLDAPSHCGILKPNEGLLPGDSIMSCNGVYALSMHADGNLVLTASVSGEQPRPLWETKTGGRGGRAAVMKADGNFALYTEDGRTLLQSGTGGNPGASLYLVGDNGTLFIGTPDGRQLWAPLNNADSVTCAEMSAARGWGSYHCDQSPNGDVCGTEGFQTADCTFCCPDPGQSGIGSAGGKGCTAAGVSALPARGGSGLLLLCGAAAALLAARGRAISRAGRNRGSPHHLFRQERTWALARRSRYSATSKSGTGA